MADMGRGGDATAGTAATRRRGRRLLVGGAIVAASVLVVGLAVVWSGFDERRSETVDPRVWATNADGQYARVNTDLHEIDSVNALEDPDRLVQAGGDLLAFTGGLSRIAAIDPANPVDITADDLVDAGDAGSGESGEDAPFEVASTPTGTRSVIQLGRDIAFLTEAGGLSAGTIPDAGPPDVAELDPLEAEREREAAESPGPESPGPESTAAAPSDEVRYRVAAAAVNGSGTLFAYSEEDQQVRRFDIASHDEIGSPERVPQPPGDDAQLSIAAFGDSWVLFDANDARMWIGASDPIATGSGADAVLESSTVEDTDAAYVADREGLVRVDLAEGRAERVVTADGTPASPRADDKGTVFAAWLTPVGGVLWNSEAGETVDLGADASVAGTLSDLQPRFEGSGERLILNETLSGQVWTVPDGRLIPLSQWEPIEQTRPQDSDSTADDIAEQRPPTAVADSFGVRAGAQAVLPVLLNDDDPNRRDVLSVQSGSFPEEADGGFGELSAITNGQRLAARVAAREGAASFEYAVTDGQAVSAAAPVHLHVVPDDENSAPVWCGVDGCRQEWPSPQVAPGGATRVSVLDAWVDPEGDPIMLLDAQKDDPADPIEVVADEHGQVDIRHVDPNAPDATSTVTITVGDDRGATTTRQLAVRVAADAPIVARAFTAPVGVGETSTIDVAPYLSGGSGTFELIDAAPTGDAEGIAVESGVGGLRFRVTGDREGSFPVSYRVRDLGTGGEATALMRITVVPADTPLSLAPQVAFVRSQEDTTVDVLGAVSNPSGAALIISSVESGSPQLQAAAVGAGEVRVSGTTEDGRAGLLGTATVSVTDGGTRSVQGQIAVYMLDALQPTPPIAVPDAATVRVGDQIDIPVLENDIAPVGDRLVLAPEVVGSGAEGELAFAAGQSLRYLAPKTPGRVTVQYTVRSADFPSSTDTTSVTVDVVAAESNAAPVPETLDARVLAGASVRIPFSGFGMDRDGDSVELDTVLQPDRGLGSATIAPEGDAIVYTAPGSGVPGGQVRFTYRVRDTQGATGDGEVRVGVLGAELSDATPVVYSDYLQAEVASPDPVLAEPLANDIDPAAGDLTIESLVPNAKEGSAEYERLDGLIDREQTSLDDGRIALRAGDVAGSQSYLYRVRSSTSSSTSEGMIVVSAVTESAKEVPVVRDTRLTSADIDQLATGVDVVTDKVSWSHGDASALRLTMWEGAPAGFTAEGATIRGAAIDRVQIVPFALTGRDFAGDDVVAYGFLRVPARENLRLELRQGVAPTEVDEEGSATVDLRDFVRLGRGADLEIDRRDDYAVSRGAARCTPSGGTTIRYAAGEGEPWTDTCTIPARLAGAGGDWQYLAVAFTIRPHEPEPELTALTRTVAPGQADAVDLAGEMTQWKGDRAGDPSTLGYAIAYRGTAFEVSQQGRRLAIEGRVDARPGTREQIEVSVPGKDAAAILTLVVGAAPDDPPRGAVLEASCRVGESCAQALVGVGGEYDPFAGKPGAGLALVAVDATRCMGAQISRDGDRDVSLRWDDADGRPAGGECVVPFTVADAQGREGSGRLTIDLQGYPGRPSSIAQTGYTGDSVRLGVDLGNAASAHPGIDAVAVYEDDTKVTDCEMGDDTATCTVGGLALGEAHRYTARARNAVGESDATNAVVAWAYAAPRVNDVDSANVRDGATSRDVGVVELTIRGERGAREYRVTGGVAPETTIPASGVGRVSVSADADTELSITPVSESGPPPIEGRDEDNTGQTFREHVHGVGTPYWIDGGKLDARRTGDSASISGTVDNRGRNGADTFETYVYVGTGAPSGCNGGDGWWSIGTGGEFSQGDIDPFSTYTVAACFTTDFGTSEVITRQVEPAQPSDVPTPVGGTSDFVVTSATSTVSGSGTTRSVRYAPAEWTSPEYTAGDDALEVRYAPFDDPSAVSAPQEGSVRSCVKGLPTSDATCSKSVTIGVDDEPSGYDFTVTFPSECPAPGSGNFTMEDLTFTGSGRDRARELTVTPDVPGDDTTEVDAYSFALTYDDDPLGSNSRAPSITYTLSCG